jgi:2-polyprenyl-3-methyl-5-hydroxy-6-metoxy-1,4-benzoquinol methylase
MNQTQPSSATPPTPERIFQTLNAYQNTAALRGAIDLDLFTAIADGAVTAPAIAARCQASERGTRILCDYLVIMGFLTKEGNEYGLTQESEIFLNQHSPAYLGTTARFLNSSYLMDASQDIAETVRRGTTLLGGQGSMDPEHPMWVEFARSMMPMMFPAAEEIAKIVGAEQGEKWRVLDIAAGHGVFGAAIAKHNPNAEVTAVDWQSVLAVAQETAEHFGIADRYHTLPGSAFEVDYGTGYDLVLFTNFFHHFDPPTCEVLMKKALAAMNEGGRAVTLEFVPNEDRISPPVQASFSLMMLVSTAAGDAYTFAEYEEMFRKAGYARSELREMTMSPQRLIISYK